MRLLRGELDTFEDALDVLDQELEDEYTQLNQNLEAYDEEVLEILQERLGEEGIVHDISKETDPLVAQLRRDTA